MSSNSAKKKKKKRISGLESIDESAHEESLHKISHRAFTLRYLIAYLLGCFIFSPFLN